MQAKFIEYGTRLDISFIKDGAVSDLMFSGSFYNTFGDLIVLVEGEEFFNHCTAAWPGFLIEIAFFAKSLKYTFTAEFVDTTLENGVNLVRVKVKTPVEEVSRRSLPRINLSTMAKVYVTTDAKTEYSFDALTIDIALNSISLYSTIKIPPNEKPEVYTVGLVLRKSSFMLPLKIIRAERSDEHEKFNTRYIFSIDFSAEKEMKDKLLFALFEYKRHA